MRRLVLLFAVFTVGCDDFATADITQTPYGSDNLRCRNGLMPASFGDLYIDQLALDGLGYYPNFEPNAVYGDEPSACISEDGTAAGFVIELDGEEAGYLYIQVDDVGAWSLADGSGDAVVELSLDTGSTSYALTSDDFTDGSVSASGVGSLFAGDLYAQSTAGSVVLISATFTVQQATTVGTSTGSTTF